MRDAIARRMVTKSELEEALEGSNPAECFMDAEGTEDDFTVTRYDANGAEMAHSRLHGKTQTYYLPA